MKNEELRKELAELLHVPANHVDIHAVVTDDSDVSVVRLSIGFNGYIVVISKEGMRPRVYYCAGNDTSYRIIWKNSSGRVENYTASNHKAAQEVIDFYHFSKARTRVFLDDGRDMTNDFYFDPKNLDTLAR